MTKVLFVSALILGTMPPATARVMPHTHPDARTYTVLAGEWKLGFGPNFDETALLTFPAGSVYTLPANVAHFQATRATETLIQVETVGPTSTDFVHPGTLKSEGAQGARERIRIPINLDKIH